LRAAGGKHLWPIPDDVWGGDEFSDDGDHRYVLWRGWEPMADRDTGLSYVAFVGLNPSTAKATIDDPTVRRCWRWARGWGYSRMAMLNVFSYRSTSPGALRTVANPIGPNNDARIREITASADLVVAAWGLRGGVREIAVVDLILQERDDIRVLALTRHGHPRHPRGLASSSVPAKPSDLVVWRSR
jgi:hypothetical protein